MSDAMADIVNDTTAGACAPRVQQGQAQRPQGQAAGGAVPACNICSGGMWDNRKDKRGGARIGAGRRQGTLSKRMVAIRDMTMKAMKETKRVPLETMLKNMVRFDDEAEAMDELVAETEELGLYQPMLVSTAT